MKGKFKKKKSAKYKNGEVKRGTIQVLMGRLLQQKSPPVLLNVCYFKLYSTQKKFDMRLNS